MNTLQMFLTMGLLSGQQIQYLLRDDFNDTTPAGSVNGSLATPTGGARVVVDTNSKLAIGAGVANFATGGVGIGNPGLWWPGFARTAGRGLFGTLSGTLNNYVLGWDSSQSTTGAVDQAINIVTPNIRLMANIGDLLPLVSAAPASGETVYCAVILRAAGALYFVKFPSLFANWTLLYVDNLSSATPMYPAIGARAGNSVFIADQIHVPLELITIAPVASDAFTRSNGVIGTTGGGGAAEAGGAGLDWVAQSGVWTIATNKAVATTAGIATVPCGTPDIMAEVVATRSAGTSGLCLRYTDADNYIKAVHNGTNLQVIEVVAGTPNTLINSAATYGATKRTVVSLSGTKVRAFYGDALIGAEATTAVTTGNDHGLSTDDTGATFDNFVIWNKGNGGEYNSLNRFF